MNDAIGSIYPFNNRYTIYKRCYDSISLKRQIILN